MTTIAGIEHNGKVYLGGESAVSFGKGQVEVSRDPKVWVVGDAVIGASGYWRGIQLTKYALDLPKLPRSKSDAALATWLTKDLASALRECWYVDGANKKNTCADLLIGVRGWLVYIDEDLSWMRAPDGLAAIGDGGIVALTSLRETTRMRQPRKRIQIALDRACKMTRKSRPPYTYVSA